MSGGVSSFTAQNIGARKYERVTQGLRAGVCLLLLLVTPIAAAFFFFAPQMVGLILHEGSTEAMAAGAVFMRWVAPFYFIIAVKIVIDGILRGSGALRYFMVSTFVGLRFPCGALIPAERRGGIYVDRICMGDRLGRCCRAAPYSSTVSAYGKSGCRLPGKRFVCKPIVKERDWEKVMKKCLATLCAVLLAFSAVLPSVSAADADVSDLLLEGAAAVSEDGYLYVGEELTGSDVAALFAGDVTVSGAGRNGYVGTGATVTAGSRTVELVVRGDLNGDGCRTVANYLLLKRAVLGISAPEGHSIRRPVFPAVPRRSPLII